MSTRSELRSQAMLATALLIATAGVFGGAAILTEARDLRVDYFTNDPAALSESGWSAGIISRVEVLIWAAATGIALFAGLARASSPAGNALIALGAVTALLVADDALMLHETVGDRVGPPVMEIAYVLLFAAVVARFSQAIVDLTPWPLLAVACAFLAASVGVDSASIDVRGATLIEDGLKVAGILIWSGYLAWTARTAIEDGRASSGSE